MNYKEMRELAQKATPGPWWIDSHGHNMTSHETFENIFSHDNTGRPAVRHPETGNLSHWRNDWDASFIATFNPETVLKLLDKIDELAAALGECVVELDSKVERQPSPVQLRKVETQHPEIPSSRLGAWLSAALDDPAVCEEMKTDIRAWFATGAHCAGDSE